MTKLDYHFYNQDVVKVAKDLLGKTLVFKNFKGIITETEAYRGMDDEACHAYRGITPRTQVMFGPPGVSYVYLIYGIYYCLNIVTEKAGQASAVLIRGLQLYHPEESKLHLNGPGKICRHLGITKHHNGIDLTSSPDFYVREGIIDAITYHTTSRIGIKKAQDKLWRFVLSDRPKT